MVRNYYRRRLRVIVGSSAGPYGFTLATWSAGAVLMSAHGIPSLLAILTFIAGAVLGFGFVGLLAFGGLEKHFDEDHGDPPSYGAASTCYRWGSRWGQRHSLVTSSRAFSLGRWEDLYTRPFTLSQRHSSPHSRTRGIIEEKSNRSFKSPTRRRAGSLICDRLKGRSLITRPRPAKLSSYSTSPQISLGRLALRTLAAR
jgi:hypothetical protein